MKLGDIETLIPTLSSISTQKLPFKLSYKITKLNSRLKDDYTFYLEKGREILDKYGEKDEKGEFKTFSNGNFIIKKGFEEPASKEMKELRDIEMDAIEIFFTPEELDCLEISPEDLAPLLPFIKE